MLFRQRFIHNCKIKVPPFPFKKVLPVVLASPDKGIMPKRFWDWDDLIIKEKAYVHMDDKKRCLAESRSSKTTFELKWNNLAKKRSRGKWGLLFGRMPSF